MKWWIAALAAGCGAASPSPTRSDTLIDASANGDVAAIDKLVRKPVTNGGLWFADMACAQQFSAPGEIVGAQLPVFARCLAALHVTPGSRGDDLRDVAVLTYAPGIEVEARFLEDKDGPWLAWIGFVGRANLHDGFPTVTPAALEALRTSGSPSIDAATGDALLAKSGAKFEAAWLKVCLDPAGKVVGVHAREASSLRAATAFAGIARAWTFRPFAVEGGAIPVCSEVFLSYPAPPTSEAAPTIPPTLPDDTSSRIVVPASRLGPRVAGDDNITPSRADQVGLVEAGIKHLVAQHAVCIDETGAVETVIPIRSSGLPEYDAELDRAMHTWRYAPYREGTDPPSRVCTIITYRYKQYGHNTYVTE